MIEDVGEKVSVALVFDAKTRAVYPRYLTWHGQVYPVTKVGYHHSYTKGATLQHVFTVTDGTMTFKLCFDTKTLHWTLERVSDGHAN